jgi:hypothetical protein
MCSIATALVLAFFLNSSNKLEAELAGLPPPEVVKAQLDFLQVHAIWIDFRDELSPGLEDGKGWCREIEKSMFTWTLLSQAQDNTAALSTRFEALNGLKEALGPNAYYRGQMPMPPLRRFKEGRPRKGELDFLSFFQNLIVLASSRGA